MGFFSDLGKSVLDPAGIFHDSKSPIQQEQHDEAERTLANAREAQDLKREQFDVLRQDAEPLREMRNSNINRLLNMQGIGVNRPQQNNASQLVDAGGGQWRYNEGDPMVSNGETTFDFKRADRRDFRSSPEFTSVRDAALKIKGDTPGMDRELRGRASRLADGEFSNFQNRIFNTAGFSSGGLNNTNRLLQQNVDAQANLLNNAGATAASGLISGANQRGQAASGALGLLGSFMCDARLKSNIERIGTYPSGIGKYRWDWTEEAKELVGEQPPIGPMAHEVAEIQPDNIGIRDGYLIVKDARLI